MIIDDHSRLLVGGELFYNDNACNFQKVLKSAIATYGIPDKLYVDNGCSYSNEQLSMICVSLGVLLLQSTSCTSFSWLVPHPPSLIRRRLQLHTAFHRAIPASLIT